MTSPRRIPAALCAAALFASLAGCASAPSFFTAIKDRFSGDPVDLEKPDRLYLAYGKWAEAQRNLPEARRSYKRVLEENHNSVDAILGLARVDHLAGRVREAEEGLLKAEALSPNNPRVLDALGQFYVAEKRWPEARDALNRAMRAAPDDEGIRYHFALALLKSGDVEGAMPHLVAAVGEAEAHYNVGIALYEQGQKEQAEKQFQLALTKKPDLQPARVWIEQLRGKTNEDVVASADRQQPSDEKDSEIVDAGWSSERPEINPGGHSEATPDPIAPDPRAAGR